MQTAVTICVLECTWSMANGSSRFKTHIGITAMNNKPTPPDVTAITYISDYNTIQKLLTDHS